MPNANGKHERTGNPPGRPRADGIPAGMAPDSRNGRAMIAATINRTLEHASLSPHAPLVLEPSAEDLDRAAALVQDEEQLAQLYALWALGVGIFSPSSTRSMQVRVKAADSLAQMRGWFKRDQPPVQVNLQANGDGGVSLVVVENARGPDALPAPVEAQVVEPDVPKPSAADQDPTPVDPEG